MLKFLLKKTRYLFKGGLKTGNKIKINLTYDNFCQANNKILLLREVHHESVERSLSYCVEHEVGNCCEMAEIAYILCHKHGLNPEISVFESDGKFNHTVCRIMVDDRKYILDPWANILCDEKNYLNTLKTKLEKWYTSGKFVFIGDDFLIDYFGKIILPDNVKLLPEDALKFKLVFSHPLEEKHHKIGSEFFSLLENKLLMKNFYDLNPVNDSVARHEAVPVIVSASM